MTYRMVSKRPLWHSSAHMQHTAGLPQGVDLNQFLEKRTETRGVVFYRAVE
jgi:hypothetical protein